MQNDQHNCSQISKHESKETRKNYQVQGLEITGAKVVGCQNYSYTCCSWCMGTVSEELENQLKTIGIPIIISCLHKVALVGTAFILRRVLVISEVVNSQMSRHFSHHIVMTSSKKNKKNNVKYRSVAKRVC